MAWSAKIQSGTGGVQGFNEWEAVYNPVTQTNLKLKYNMSLGSQAPEVLYHTPDNGSPIPVRATGKNKLIFLTVDVPTKSSWDDVLEIVNTLARLVDGPNSQAFRAQTDKSAEKVRVAIRPDGATYTTYYEVLHGFMDTSTAFTEPVAVLNVMGRNITLALTCVPFGKGEPFALKNMLPSSPHMLEDTNSDGLADGLTLVNSPTPSIATNRYLVGGKSQKITTAASGDEGFATGTIAITGGDYLVAYIDAVTIHDPISLILRDDTGVIQQKKLLLNDSTAVSSRSMIGESPSSSARTWYRVQLEGASDGAASTAWLQVRRLSADATQATQFWVDKMYLDIARETPPAFGSTKNLVNRYDPSVDTDNINYLDVCDIPGDAPALVNVQLEPGTGDALKYYMGAFADGQYLVADTPHWRDTEGWTGTSGTWTTGTGTIDNHYHQCSTTTGVLSLTSSFGRQYAHQTWRVLALAYTSDVDATIQLAITYSGVTLAESSVGQLNKATTWQWVDLGVINMQGVMSDDVAGSLTQQISITQDASQTIRLDGLLYLPTQLGFSITEALSFPAVPRTVDIFYDASRQKAYTLTEGLRINMLGSVPLLLPGTPTSRYVFAVADFTDDVEITTDFAVTLTVTPRTSHLLGVA